MSARRRLAVLSAFIVGFWPVGLLVGGVDFFRLPGALPFAFLLGLAGAHDAARWRWPAAAAAGAGLAAAFTLLLLVVGAEWHFVGFAFAGARPFFVAAACGALTRLAIQALPGFTRTVGAAPRRKP
jgi:hypothetical protein